MRKITVHTLDTLKTKILESGDCWIWQGYFGNGVPSVHHGGKMRPVRWVMMEVQGKEVHSNTSFLAPSCGNPACVAPHHISQRSRKLQLKMMGKKANAPDIKPARVLKMTQTRRKTYAKLDINTAREIRASDEPGSKLAEKYGVSKSLVNRIKNGKQWKDFSNPFTALIR